MWYSIDFVKLVSILLPPILRSKFLMTFMRILILPLRYVYGIFNEHKDEIDDKLNVSANVINLENALNRLFCLVNGQIYIVSTADANRCVYLHFGSELFAPFRMFLSAEKKNVYLVHEYESSAPINFIVMVPTFLCTSIDSKSEDKYGWKNLNIIKNLLNIYKPAGRTFSINLYDYE